MDLTTISTAYSGLKNARDILSALLNTKIESEVQARIGEVLDRLGQAQDTLFSMREELFRLQSENADLRRKVESQQNWQDRLSKYELVETPGKAVVYQSKTQPVHFVCPSCLEKQEIHILQDRKVIAGIFDCPGCDKTFPIKPTVTPTTRTRIRY